MEKPHHSRMQTVDNTNNRHSQLEEYNILYRDLNDVIKPENNGKQSQQTRRLSDVDSNLMEDPYFNLTQDTITSQRNIKGAHEAEITLDENMFMKICSYIKK